MSRLSGAKGSMVLRNVWSILDHGTMAAVSFAVNLTLARNLPLDAYGFYVLLLVFLNFAGDIFGALILSPLLVLGAARDERNQPSYLAAMAGLQVAGSIVAAVLFAVGAGVAYFAEYSATIVEAIIAAAFTAFAMPLLQFMRRAFYAAQRPELSFQCSLTYAILQAGGLASLLALQSLWGALTSTHVFVSQCVAALAGAAFGIWRGRPLFAHPSAQTPAILSESWRYGRWILFGVFVTMGYSQAIYILIATFAGAEGVAKFEGPRLLVAPCLILIQAWGTMITAPASRTYAQHGPQAAVRLLMRSSLLVVATVAPFLAFMIMGPQTVLEFALGASFASERANLMLWAGIMTAMMVSTITSSVFYLFQRPELGTYCRIAGAVVGLPAATLLVWSMGATGGASARFAVELILVTMSAYLAFRLIRRKKILDA